nr:hypothetical protein [Tanacetum cinerariifolium]
MLSEAQGVSLRITSGVRVRKLRWRGRSWVSDLNKSDLCPNFVEGPTAKGLEPSHGDFLTGNHLKDSFTPLNYSKVLKYNWEKILFELEGEASEPKRMAMSKARASVLDALNYKSTCRGLVESLNEDYSIFFLGSYMVLPSSPLFLSCAWLMVVSPLSTSSKGSLICVEMEQEVLDSKSFKDKLPLNIKDNPMFQRLGRYPMSVHVFPDPIFFLDGLKPLWEYGQQRPAIMAGGKEMAFMNFIFTEDDEDLLFLPKKPSPGFGTGSLSVLESLKPELFVVHPRSVAARIKDRKCKTRGGSSRPHAKRKHSPGSSTSRATCSRTSSLKYDVPYLTLSDDDEGLPNFLEFKDTTACHLKISAITPLAWKNHLNNHIDVELLDLHNRCYARQAVVDNDKERAREEECEVPQAKCEAAMTDFEKKPTIVALRDKISTLSTKIKEHKASLNRMMLESHKWACYQQSLSTLELKVTSLKAKNARLNAVEVSLRKEVEELKQDRREVVSKFVPYATEKLVHSDDMGSLVGRLVSFAILYGMCRAYEQVADMKKPFDLSKVKGYCSSYKKDHTQASNDLAITTFPWLDEFMADPSASIEALLLKKPLSL